MEFLKLKLRNKLYINEYFAFKFVDFEPLNLGVPRNFLKDQAVLKKSQHFWEFTVYSPIFSFYWRLILDHIMVTSTNVRTN